MGENPRPGGTESVAQAGPTLADTALKMAVSIDIWRRNGLETAAFRAARPSAEDRSIYHFRVFPTIVPDAAFQSIRIVP